MVGLISAVTMGASSGVANRHSARQPVRLVSGTSTPVYAPRVAVSPSGYVARPPQSEVITTSDGSTVDVESLRLTHANPTNGRVDGSLYVNASTDSSAFDPALDNALDDATQVGELAGAPLFYSPGNDATSARELRWLINPYTEVAFGATGNVPYGVAELTSLAQSVSFAKTGTTVSLETSDSSSITVQPAAKVQVLPEGTASCVSYCPASTDMNGAGVLTDDWGDNQEICNGCSIQQGNIVGVWQGVLWVDGANNNSPTYTNCDVDGAFGARTQYATEEWQAIRMGGAYGDGIVGPQTWSAADNQLKSDGSLVIYAGIWTNLYFERQAVSPYHYTWSWNSSPYYYTGYYGIQIAKSTSNCHQA